MSEFVIWDQKTVLFWSNDDGWVDIDSATKFSREEINRISHFPAGGSPLELIPNYYEIVATSHDAPGAPLIYRGHVYLLPGHNVVYLALTKEFGDLTEWLDDAGDVQYLKEAMPPYDFHNDDMTYQVAISDESYGDKPRAYLLCVGHDDLDGQIKTLSGLLSSLPNDKYTATVGAVELLEEIQKQRAKP